MLWLNLMYLSNFF